MSNVQDTIINETKKLIQAKGLDCPQLSSDSQFLSDLPMDSLDLATLIVTLESAFKTDPFRDGFKTFHSVAELSALYEDALNG